MLAELYTLKQNLEKGNQGITLTHRDFQTPPGLTTYKTLIARINDAGEITELRLPIEDEKSGLWTLKKGNFKFFPAVRPDLPLYELALNSPLRDLVFSKAASKSVKLVQWKQEVLEIIKDTTLNPQNFLPLYNEQGKPMLNWENENKDVTNQLKGFAKAFGAFCKDPKSAAEQLSKAVFNQNHSDKDWMTVLAHLLFGQQKEEKGKSPKIVVNVQIIFDYDAKDYEGFTIHDKTVHQIVLQCLCRKVSNVLETDTKKGKSKPVPLEKTAFAQECAFSPSSVTLLRKPFGGFSIQPVINKEQAPYSKKGASQGVPCNDRYHKSDSDGFPVGESLARELVGAMKTITQPDNLDKTWRTIKNGRIEEKKGKKKEGYDVLIAHTNFPADDVKTVTTFGKLYTEAAKEDQQELENEKDAEKIEVDARKFKAKKAAFVQASEPVCLGFNKKLKDYPSGRLDILLVRQISPGQIQLAYSAKIFIQDFIKALERWKDTEGNFPDNLKIPVQIKGVSGFRRLAPSLLFPEEMGSLFTYLWIRDGTECSRLNGPPVGKILDLFLNRPWVKEADILSLLDLALTRAMPLLVHGGGRLRKMITPDDEIWQHFVATAKGSKPDGSKPDPRWYLLNYLSLIGTLLSLTNSTSKLYMNQTAYLTGCLLACADEIHKLYHVAMSDGKLPSTLIGNGLLGKAIEAPSAALAELCERSRIYIGWAKVAKQEPVPDDLKLDKSPEARKSPEVRKKKAKLYAASNARHVLKVMELLSERLYADGQANDLNNELSTAEKAQLFLGYLSPIPKKKFGKTAEGETDLPTVEENQLHND